MSASPDSPPGSSPLRVVVTCPRCSRQYLAGAFRAGDLFRCSCGAVVTVPSVVPREAEVVRCEACGAPRSPGDARCRFCGADFERDEGERNTICPACGARVSDRARFCSHCGARIEPETVAGETSTFPCPACGGGATLLSRRLATLDAAVLECPRCAGLWIGADVFARAVEKAESSDPALGRPPAAASSPAAPAGSPLYRPCPICGRLMNRRNFGDRSGVILDLCSPHGVWFDADELARVLDWVRAGGLRAARALAAEAARERPPAGIAPSAPFPEDDESIGAVGRGIRFLGAVLETLFDRLHRS